MLPLSDLTQAAQPDLTEQIASVHWYHAMELPGGVVTPGFYDMPGTVGKVPLPESLAGKRCLDVGTADGFWAFEMERRGAAEVVALDVASLADVDWPLRHRPAGKLDRAPAPGFEVAHRALGSCVERVLSPVYDLPAVVGGGFDFVFMGALLLHLRDPAGALAAIREVTAGEFLSFDVISLRLTLRSPRVPAARLTAVDQAYWWTPNLAAHRRLIHAAGFDVVDSRGPLFMPLTSHAHKQLAAAGSSNPRPTELLLKHRGVACAWVKATPARLG